MIWAYIFRFLVSETFSMLRTTDEASWTTVMHASWWLPWVLGPRRLVSASPPHPPPLDFRAPLFPSLSGIVLSQWPQAPSHPPQEVSGKPTFPQGCVFHIHSSPHHYSPCRRVSFLQYTLGVKCLRCQPLQWTGSLGEGFSPSIGLFLRAPICIRGITFWVDCW